MVKKSEHNRISGPILGHIYVTQVATSPEVAAVAFKAASEAAKDVTFRSQVAGEEYIYWYTVWWIKVYVNYIIILYIKIIKAK